MKVGVVFPQSESGTDPIAIRDYAQAVEGMGYSHILAYDHVLGASTTTRPDWGGSYDSETVFHEVFVLFGYFAALTTTVELVTGVVILPQRQTVLVAKQAAEIDLLTGGRFRLGVGVGWNRVEYDALGQDFTTRGRRSGEQVELLRRLWTQRSIDATVGVEQVIGAGIAPVPVQPPIRVWLGCSSPPASRRAGRLGDGWFPQMQPGADLDQARLIVEGAARDAGRDPSSLGMEGRISWRGGVEDTAAAVERWRAVGATHLSINTMGAGLSSVDDHVAALASLATVLGLG